MSEKKDERMVMKLGKEDGEGGKHDVVADLDRVKNVIDKVREAFLTIKDSDISVKGWNFAFNKIDGEYNIDFTLKLTLSPKEMDLSELEASSE